MKNLRIYHYLANNQEDFVKNFKYLQSIFFFFEFFEIFVLKIKNP